MGFSGWLLDDPCPFVFKSVLLSMSKMSKMSVHFGDLVPCPFMSKIAILVLLNPRANQTANISADFFGQLRRALSCYRPRL